MKFTSKYQTLTVMGEVSDDGITQEVIAQFEDGEFETDDEDVAARLRTIEDVEDLGSGGGSSLKSKNKAELLVFAEAEEIEGREEMTKAELIEALRGKQE